MRTIHVEDGVAAPLEILPILAPERMADLLGRELEALGFVRDGQDGKTCKRTAADGTEVTIDLAAATVSVRLGADHDVEATADRAQHVAIEARDYAEQRMRQQAVADAEGLVEQRAEELRRAVTAELERRLADLQRELDGAIGKATIAALTEKAAQLGSIEEQHVDEAGNVTIRVRL